MKLWFVGSLIVICFAGCAPAPAPPTGAPAAAPAAAQNITIRMHGDQPQAFWTMQRGEGKVVQTQFSLPHDETFPAVPGERIEVAGGVVGSLNLPTAPNLTIEIYQGATLVAAGKTGDQSKHMVQVAYTVPGG